jgi:ELP3 family radical SAM enzyme/protein acetyltransferase
MVVPWTEIEKWYRDGTYVPYSESQLMDIILRYKPLFYPFIRVNRLIRDFPEGDYSITDANIGHMRNQIADVLTKDGTRCQCIRCREPKDKPWDGQYTLVIRKYGASDGIEYFISAESHDTRTIYGFIRLRIPSSPVNDIFPELSFCALIRELHVYGRVKVVHDPTTKSNVQHRGIGKALVAKAVTIAKENHYHRLAVISGCGVKEYYEKLGFQDHPNASYLVKDLLN